VPSPHKLPTAAHNEVESSWATPCQSRSPKTPRVTNAVKSRTEDLECSKDDELDSSTQSFLTNSHFTWMGELKLGRVREDEEAALSLFWFEWNGKRERKGVVKGYLYPSAEI
jgi:hypothetical protein